MVAAGYCRHPSSQQSFANDLLISWIELKHTSFQLVTFGNSNDVAI